MQATVRNRLYRFLAPLWPLTVLCVVVGVALGLFVASHLGRSATATALIRIDPTAGPDQILTGAAPASDAPQAYLADQLAYLSSDGYRREVAQSLQMSSPVDLTATQEGQSMVVRIAATAAEPDTATQIVNAAVDLYRRVANDSTGQRLTAAIGAVDSVIEATRAEAIARVGGNAEDVDQAALDARLEPLRTQKVSLDVALRRGAGVDVIDPTWSGDVEAAVSPALGAVGGGLLGGLLGLACGLWWRARSGVIASAGTLEREVRPVLRPVVTLGKKTGKLSAKEAVLARALYYQLPSPRAGRIVVVGATPNSGADTVGRLLLHAAAEHGSVAAFNASDFVGMRHEQMVGELNLLEASHHDAETTIVFGPSFATAPALIELLPFARHVVLVVRIGVDTASQVQASYRSVAGLAVPTTGVATRAGLFGSANSTNDFGHQLPSARSDADATT
ncbi:hypothetical protein TUM20985_50500 [Mycobacterium antarcticum]|uniref:hypothetical protein n=1 Tax=Mycolicibacterium sp. TUM20985 TaxID=3023370 RepID=UPI00257307DD|nr:hypothetical protein [Mycolicibacterium sp. TUM20985]BDX34503.1 hypothetical protein TUM20985_50500 [Mycolicibacterium sp. TUM20985]